MNGTLGEMDLVPSRIVFGILPRFPMLSTDLPNQKSRMEAIESAQAEISLIVAERRVFETLTENFH